MKPYILTHLDIQNIINTFPGTRHTTDADTPHYNIFRFDESCIIRYYVLYGVNKIEEYLETQGISFSVLDFTESAISGWTFIKD